MGESAYSYSLTTFSPSGKLVQIEYALNAVAAGRPALGIRARNGVVLATEKKVRAGARGRPQVVPVGTGALQFRFIQFCLYQFISECLGHYFRGSRPRGALGRNGDAV